MKLLLDNCLVKSVGFARRCTKMGVEAKVVPCLVLFHLRVPVAHFRAPVVGPHFYAEVLGKRYEVSGNPNGEKYDEPKVLFRLGRVKILCSKSR